LIEFKERLLTANFLKYEVLFQSECSENDKGEEKIASSGEEHGLRRVEGESTPTMQMIDYRVDSAFEAFDNLAALLSDSSVQNGEEFIFQLVS
jgi:hypothetical protein